MSGADHQAKLFVEEFATELGCDPDWHIKSRPDGDYIVLEFAEPNERLFRVLESVASRLSDVNEFSGRVTISRRSKRPLALVAMPEARLLQKELSESLTVDRNTFGDDFLARYTPSVTNFEQSIVGNANYIVYGRRGSGKSSLLAYAMHKVSRRRGFPHAWVALQTYAGRSDWQTIPAVLAEIFRELAKFAEDRAAFDSLNDQLSSISESSGRVEEKVVRLLPRARTLLASISSRDAPVTIFLDDIHVVAESLQPRLLSLIYSVSRGNNCYIKVSGIEQFTNIWDSASRIGLEPPHDAQILKLDYNLTMPDKSKEHIVSILDAHAKFCGLPNAGYISEGEVLSRLVLVAAAVPRDALSLFSQAITKSNVKAQRAVTITSVNAAASETVEEKLKDVGKDMTSAEAGGVQTMLDSLRDFCIKREGKNAFLVRIDSRSSDFRMIQNLIALRFVHVLHEGITPHKVGERYVALMLDFGFYIGIRAAKSVKLFPDRPRQLTAKELRALPIFSSDLSATDRRVAKTNSRAKRSSDSSQDSRGAVTRKAGSGGESSPKAVAKKAVAKKAVPKKAVAKKAVAKKAVLKKTVAKKVVPKKAVSKKAVAKKSVRKKVAAKKG